MYNFKVGDFVKYIHSNASKPLKINNINYSRYYFEGTSMSCLDYELIPWTPEPGEWCWFFNKDRIPTISQFVEFHKDINKYFATYPNKQKSFGAYYTHCEPFIGELPSNLKDL